MPSDFSQNSSVQQSSVVEPFSLKSKRQNKETSLELQVQVLHILQVFAVP